MSGSGPSNEPLELPDQDWRPRDLDGSFKDAIIYDDSVLVGDEDDERKAEAYCDCGALLGEFGESDIGTEIDCPSCGEVVNIG